MTRVEFEHPSHPGHVLKLYSCEDPYECHACKEPGLGPRYACTSRRCDFHLHTECPHAAQELFPGCSLLPTSSNCSRVCNVCGHVVRGFSYRRAHPRCLAHPHVVTGNGGIPVCLSGDAPSECYRCGRKEVASMVLGFSYVSSCGMVFCHLVGGIDRHPAAPRANNRQPEAPVSRDSRRETLIPNKTTLPGTLRINNRCATLVPSNIPHETQVSSDAPRETHRREAVGRRNRRRENVVLSNSHIEAIVRCKSGVETLVVSETHVPRKSLKEIRFQRS